MYAEFGQPRLRVTEKTLRSIGRRTQLRDSHKAEVRALLEDNFGLALVECSRGFVMFRLASLDGTRSWTFRAFRERTTVDWREEDEVWHHAETQMEDTDVLDEDED